MNRHARAKRPISLVLALAALSVPLPVAISAARSAGAWAIAKAPNHGRSIADDSRVSPPPPDVQRVVRAEVGPPDAELEAWILDPPHPPTATVLVLHGIRADKSAMVGVARSAVQRGFRAVLVDLRGHGNSSGQWLTYGAVESRDLVELLDHMDSLQLLQRPLAVYGPSYGGAVAIQLAARDERVVAVASLSTFASLRQVVRSYGDSVLGPIASLMPDPLIESMTDDAGNLAGFSPEDADTTEAIARTRAHVLLIHGRQDEQIPYSQAEELRAACRGPCRLLPIEGEDHHGTLASPQAHGAAFEFLEQSLSNGRI